MPIDLSKIKKIHFIGIKGVAMSGLAVISKQMGFEVAGSDIPEKFITDKILVKEGIKIFENFDENNLSWSPDLVVVGASWSNDNPEVATAKDRNILLISDSEMRGILSLRKRTIAITGVHGKTTTTALLAHIFNQAGLNPSFLIGTGNVSDLGSNARWDSGKHFIVEGDEYIRSQADRIPKFLDLSADISIITSLEWEHVDVYKNLEEIEKAFEKLIDRTKDLAVVCGDWPSIKKITKGKKGNVITYGLHPNNSWQAYDICQKSNKTFFKVRNKDQELGVFSILLCGAHNVLNALAGLIVSHHEGISLKKIGIALSTFSGTERRFEVFEKNGIIFVDDYAHHPGEIAATLKAARGRYPGKKIYCVFQPHMASRTKALLDDFAISFSDADKIFLVDIFASAREKVGEITSRELAEQIKKHHNDVEYAGGLPQTLENLKGKIKKGMVVITMGAGDIYKIKDKLISYLK